MHLFRPVLILLSTIPTSPVVYIFLDVASFTSLSHIHLSSLFLTLLFFPHSFSSLTPHDMPLKPHPQTFPQFGSSDINQFSYIKKNHFMISSFSKPIFSSLTTYLSHIILLFSYLWLLAEVPRDWLLFL